MIKWEIEAIEMGEDPDEYIEEKILVEDDLVDKKTLNVVLRVYWKSNHSH